MKSILLSFSLLLFLNLNIQAASKLYIVANPTNAGDVNQGEGIKTAFESLSPQEITSEFLDARLPQEIQQKVEDDLKNNQQIILIGTGEGGIDGVQNLAAHPNLIICLSSHMLLERYKDRTLLDKVRFIALPTHVSYKDKKVIGKKLIETVGVSHNRAPENADKTYQEWSKELPTCSSYISVILGGDAPLPPPAKGMKRFTKTDAMNLATYVASRSKETKACVIVLNGPRTGKHDESQKEILTVHRGGYSDLVTEYFTQQLKKNGVEFTLFDFQHKTPENKQWVSPYNSFDLIVGALRTRDGVLLVPGESTSMASEAIDTLPPGKVLVYKNGAMNKVHEAHVASELISGRVAVLENYKDVQEPLVSLGGPKPSAAKVIAQALLEATKKK